MTAIVTRYRISSGTDTFIVGNGRIVVQTMAAKAEEPPCQPRSSGAGLLGRPFGQRITFLGTREDGSTLVRAQAFGAPTSRRRDETGGRGGQPHSTESHNSGVARMSSLAASTSLGLEQRRHILGNGEKRKLARRGLAGERNLQPLTTALVGEREGRLSQLVPGIPVGTGKQ